MAMNSNPIISKHDQCKQDINQLFTDMSTKLTDRRRVLLLKLDGIEKRYTAAKDNSQKLENMKIKQQAILASMEKMGGLITAETKQSLLEAFRQTNLSCNNWKAKKEEFSYICFRYHTIGSINSINWLGTIKVIARSFSGRTVNEDNFLTRLNQCRQQIDQLFSGLSTNLADRKQVLSVEFDGIVNRYAAAKYNFNQLENMKINQQAILASITRMGGLISADTKQSLEEAFLRTELRCNNWKAEIEEFSNISFKYDITGPLNSIHQLGAITIDVLPNTHLSVAGGTPDEVVIIERLEVIQDQRLPALSISQQLNTPNPTRNTQDTCCGIDCEKCCYNCSHFEDKKLCLLIFGIPIYIFPIILFGSIVIVLASLIGIQLLIIYIGLVFVLPGLIWSVCFCSVFYNLYLRV